jgi:hypothetical protein
VKPLWRRMRTAPRCHVYPDDTGGPPRRNRAPKYPDGFRTSRSVAVDGTDVETWGALHGDAVHRRADGEAADTRLMDDGEAPKGSRHRHVEADRADLCDRPPRLRSITVPQRRA